MKKKKQPTIVHEKKENHNWFSVIVWGISSFLCTTILVFALSKWVKPGSLNLKNISQGFLKRRISFVELAHKGGKVMDPYILTKLIEGQNKEYVCIDFRSKEEYDMAHIKSAVNIPLYNDYRSMYETQAKMDEWFGIFSKKVWGKKIVVLYGYGEKAQITRSLTEYLSRRRATYSLLSVGFTEFKNNYYQWMPGGDLNMTTSGAYIEGKLIEPVIPFDGVPPLPEPKQ